MDATATGLADTRSGDTIMATVDCRQGCRDEFDDDDPYGNPFAVADTEHSDAVRAEEECLTRARGEASRESSTSARRPSQRLHRIAEVRRRQGVTLRNVARRLGVALPTIRRQEEPDCDLRISDLQRWQAALDVPIAELLVEGDGQLSGPVLERSRMVKLMKTAAAIRERTGGTPVGKLVGMLIDQILEIMPELRDVAPWHTAGQRRTLDDVGRTARHVVPEDLFRRGG
jgi:transcriptional regulator with XRE-family HTH domain